MPNKTVAGIVCAQVALLAATGPSNRALAFPHTLYISERSGFFGTPLSEIGEFSSAVPSNVNHKGASASPRPNFIGIDVRPGTGFLYGLEYTPTGSIGSLRTIDPNSGASVRVGGGPNLVPMASPNPIGGLSFDATGSVLWGTDSVKLFRIDISSGVMLTPTFDVHGLPANVKLGDIAITPNGVPTLPQGTIVGLAIYPSNPPHAAELVILTPNLMTLKAEATLIAPITGDVSSSNFSGGIYYNDQGLDFATDGTLYACLISNLQTATLFTISMAADATLGRASYLGRVQANFTWDPGGLAVADDVPPPCNRCHGDANNDGHVDGRDVPGFVASILNAYEPCCDMNGSGPPISVQDVSDFTSQLLAPACPP